MKFLLRTLLLISALQVASCVTPQVDPQLAKVEKLLAAPIDNPFTAAPNLGIDAKAQNFVIKTSVGDTEYTVEIPNGGQDYDIVVPLANIQNGKLENKDYTAKDAIQTDKEMVATLPAIQNRKGSATALMDKAYGVGPTGGVKQSPSYTLKLVNIKQHYKNKDFELALIEVNKLLSHYPTSPQLYKMKGSIFLKLRQLSLAEKSWARAIELEPNDKVLKTGLARLQQKLISQGQLKPADIETDYAH